MWGADFWTEHFLLLRSFTGFLPSFFLLFHEKQWSRAKTWVFSLFDCLVVSFVRENQRVSAELSFVLWKSTIVGKACWKLESRKCLNFSRFLLFREIQEFLVKPKVQSYSWSHVFHCGVRTWAALLSVVVLFCEDMYSKKRRPIRGRS